MSPREALNKLFSFSQREKGGMRAILKIQALAIV
jgi:hypothetical protein